MAQKKQKKGGRTDPEWTPDVHHGPGPTRADRHEFLTQPTCVTGRTPTVHNFPVVNPTRNSHNSTTINDVRCCSCSRFQKCLDKGGFSRTTCECILAGRQCTNCCGFKCKCTNRVRVTVNEASPTPMNTEDHQDPLTQDSVLRDDAAINFFTLTQDSIQYFTTQETSPTQDIDNVPQEPPLDDTPDEETNNSTLPTDQHQDDPSQNHTPDPAITTQDEANTNTATSPDEPAILPHSPTAPDSDHPQPTTQQEANRVPPDTHDNPSSPDTAESPDEEETPSTPSTDGDKTQPFTPSDRLSTNPSISASIVDFRRITRSTKIIQNSATVPIPNTINTPRPPRHHFGLRSQPNPATTATPTTPRAPATKRLIHQTDVYTSRKTPSPTADPIPAHQNIPQVDPPMTQPPGTPTMGDQLLKDVYGSTISASTGTDQTGDIDTDPYWQDLWRRTVQLQPSLYTLPRGRTAKRFIALLTQELHGVRT